MPTQAQLRALLNAKVQAFNQPGFIADDPVSLPHRYIDPVDIEVSGFLAATIAWGNRKTILNSASKLCALMDDAPRQFLLEHTPKDLRRFEGFVHRTFNGDDALFFIGRLAQLYRRGSGLEDLFTSSFAQHDNLAEAIGAAKDAFFDAPHLERTRKHFSDPRKGSAAKRLNMYLRWMVRDDQAGVDFGQWKGIPMSALRMPLDVHTGNVARHLGLLTRKQNDWKAVEELTAALTKFDPEDPVKYDFALFGMGAVEGVR